MIKAKKSLGQNFLIDKEIIKKIVDLIDLKNKTVLEVGPGTGNLTFQILNKNPKKLLVIEKDNQVSFIPSTTDDTSKVDASKAGSQLEDIIKAILSNYPDYRAD